MINVFRWIFFVRVKCRLGADFRIGGRCSDSTVKRLVCCIKGIAFRVKRSALSLVWALKKSRSNSGL